MELKQLIHQAESGEADAQYLLAMKYIYGDGVEEDNEKAFILLTESAEQDHMEASYNLGICYHYGYGTAVDHEKAFRYYMRAAAAGHGKGMTLVGKFYYDGVYVHQDYQQAVMWFRKALDSEDISAVAYAQFLLGRCYARGHGVTQSKETALSLYQKAAANGDPNAAEMLTEL